MVVSGEGRIRRWWGGRLTCSCDPNDDDDVVLLSLTAWGLGKEGGGVSGGSGGGELVSSK